MLPKSQLCWLVALMVICGASLAGHAQTPAGKSLQKTVTVDLWPALQHDKYGFIDKTGRLIIPPKFGYAFNFSEGLAAVELNGYYGYIDKTGHFIIPPRFDWAYPFSDGLAVAVIRRRDGQGNITVNKFGYIDRSGRMVIQPRGVADPKFLSFFSEGLACVMQGDKIGYIDKTGKVVIPAQYIDAHPFCEGLAAVTVANKYGYIDRSGKMVIAPQFDDVGPFCEGLAHVELNEKQGFVDRTGKMVITGEEFVDARGFSEGLAAARGKNGKSGFIDKTGHFVIPPQFEHVGEFHEGLAAVKQIGAQWPGDLSYINKNGQIVIKSMSTFPDSPMKTEFDLRNYRFRGGLAKVELGDEKDTDAEGYINQEGMLVWPQTHPSKKKVHQHLSSSP